MTKVIAERMKPTVVGMVCDRCKKVYDENSYEIHEFLSWKMTAGYGNTTYGDLNRLEIDLCQYCTKEVLGDWIRVYEHFSDNDLIKLLTEQEYKE
jgi:hypothetical protein